MNYKIVHREDGDIELTRIEKDILRAPTRLASGQRDKDTGWTFDELKALGPQESIPIRKRVRIVIESKTSRSIEVRPAALGSMATTESVNKSGQGGEGRHTYSGLTFSELDALEIGVEHWVEKRF